MSQFREHELPPKIDFPNEDDLGTFTLAIGAATILRESVRGSVKKAVLYGALGGALVVKAAKSLTSRHEGRVPFLDRAELAWMEIRDTIISP